MYPAQTSLYETASKKRLTHNYPNHDALEARKLACVGDPYALVIYKRDTTSPNNKSFGYLDTEKIKLLRAGKLKRKLFLFTSRKEFVTNQTNSKLVTCQIFLQEEKISTSCICEEIQSLSLRTYTL